MFKKLLGFAKEIQTAALSTDRRAYAIIAEIAFIRLSQGRLGFSEYFDYELYKSDISLAEKTAFGGWRAQAYLESMCIDELSEFMTIDKITMYSIFSAYNLPFPCVKAYYDTIRPLSSTAVQLKNEIDLLNYINNDNNLPVYIKPSSSSFGRGNFMVSKVQNEKYILGNSEAIDNYELISRLDNRRGLGWILQEPLDSHDSIVAVTGTRKISGLRIHTFLTPNGPKIVRAIWRINSGKNDFDQFKYGESGNLISEVDIENGRILRVVGGFRSTRTLHTTNPVNGASLLGFTIPFWDKIKTLVCDAHRAFPGYLCPGWDIAICNDGPRILEVNAFGDIDTSQHASRKGFLDNEFLSLLEARNLLKEIPQGNIFKRMFWSQPARDKFRSQWGW